LSPAALKGIIRVKFINEQVNNASWHIVTLYLHCKSGVTCCFYVCSILCVDYAAAAAFNSTAVSAGPEVTIDYQ